MARPTNRSRRRSPVPFIIPDGLSAKKIEFEPSEDKREQEHRLWKDRISSLINDVLASVVAFAVLLALVIFGFVTLLKTGASQGDRRFATSMLAAVGTAVAGFAFGKGKK